MADSTWFFSTLAQATAASIGFVVAFAAALYSVRRAKRQRIVGEFQEDIREYFDRVQPVAEEMRKKLRDVGEFNPDFDLHSDLGEEELEDTMRRIDEWSQDQQHRQAAYVWANLRLFEYILRRIMETSSPKVMAEYLSQLESPVINIVTSFDAFPSHPRDPKPYKDLFHEVTGNTREKSTKYKPDHHIFGFMPKLDNYIGEYTTANESSATIMGWSAAVRQMNDSFYRIYNLSDFSTALFNEDVVGPVLQTCQTLFVVGVILPTLFLITVPEIPLLPELPTLVITVVEVIVLGVTGYFGYQLFKSLIEMVGESSY